MADKVVQDEILVKKTLEGKKEFFEILVMKYQRRIFGIVYKLTRDPSVVQDLAQEIFFKAYRKLDSFNFRSSFYTWLVKIALNTTLNYLSSRDREPSWKQEELHGISDTEAFEGIAGGKDPESYLLRGELLQNVKEAILSLPVELRSAIILRELEGFSYEEIAEILNCPIGTVRSRIHRGRKELQKALTSYLEREGRDGM